MLRNVGWPVCLSQKQAVMIRTHLLVTAYHDIVMLCPHFVNAHAVQVTVWW